MILADETFHFMPGARLPSDAASSEASDAWLPGYFSNVKQQPNPVATPRAGTYSGKFRSVSFVPEDASTGTLAGRVCSIATYAGISLGHIKIVSHPTFNGEYRMDGFGSQSSSATDSVPVTEAVLNQMYAYVADEAIKKAVAIAFSRIETAFADFDLLAVNDFLVKADVSRLPVRVLVAMLRSSSRARDRLFGWKMLLLKAKSKAAREHMDVERVFWGLV